MQEPEEDAGDEEETETDAKERMRGELSHIYDADVSRIDSVKVRRNLMKAIKRNSWF